MAPCCCIINGLFVRPGRQIALNNCFPVNVAVEPKGRYAAVLLAGYTPHEVVAVDLKNGVVTSRAPLREAFYGLIFSRDGKALYCSGGGDEVVHRFNFLNGVLTNHTEIKVHDRTLRAVPCGLALDRAEKRLFVADVLGDSVAEVDLVEALCPRFQCWRQARAFGDGAGHSS